MELRIDPEFEGKIPPLTAEEFQQLENNILADGVVINPIIVWDGVIVDGHNRYRIVSKHPEIQFSTCEKTFADRYEAIAWICKNQLGRRNLTKEQKAFERRTGIPSSAFRCFIQVRSGKAYLKA